MNAEQRLAGNALAIGRELEWLAAVVEWRLSVHRNGPLPPAPAPEPEASPHGELVDRLRLGQDERLVLALALAPHVRPETLDPLFRVNEGTGRGRTEVGGVQGRSHSGFLPTVETALFLLAGPDLLARFLAEGLFEPSRRLVQEGLLRVENAPSGEPGASGLLSLSEATLGLLTNGVPKRPEFSRDFPARRLVTPMTWKNLVLSPETSQELRELEAWVAHEGRLRRSGPLAERLRGGYRAIFYGPPGTGKTLTATLLGQRVARDVYRVSLSAVVSKYIGETAKNLEGLFARAEHLGCILFFDEADALFGKRTQVSDARDRYANQEISYLLQRVEDFRGMVILATNFESNIDAAFMRRFHALVHFPAPSAEQRLRLWTESLPNDCSLERGVDLRALAEEHPLTGAGIVNVIQYAALMAYASDAVIRRSDLLSAIRRELQKEGKTL